MLKPTTDTEGEASCFACAIGSSHYVACQLTRLLSFDILGVKEEEYAAHYARRHVELLTCLTNAGDERRTYELRLIARPDPVMPAHGSIAVAVLCRLDGGSASDAATHGCELLHLCDALFDEYVFAPVPAAEIPALLEPLPVRHLVAVTRRAGRERLDTLKSGRRSTGLGFSPPDRPDASAAWEPASVFHVYPYLPTGAAFTTLFRLLLLAPHPMP